MPAKKIATKTVKRVSLKGAAPKGKAVVICTEKRGVFFGYVVKDESPAQITLSSPRNCLYWSADVKGVLGLASNGPSESCRIGPAAKDGTFFQVTAVLGCSDEAVSAWEKAPWK